MNSLKHGLLATTIPPSAIPGEKPGLYEARRDQWFDNMLPGNVFECAILERAVRSSWRLDRCVRFEDAAAARRAMMPADTAKVHAGKSTPLDDAEYLGRRLMFIVGYWEKHREVPTNPDCIDFLDDAPGDLDRLSSFREGVEWLLNAWHEVIEFLPRDNQPPVKGADVVIVRNWRKIMRLLGLHGALSPPEQPIVDAADAEIDRLEALLQKYKDNPDTQRMFDLALFADGPSPELMLRYESMAERSLFKSIDAFTKLRKNAAILTNEDETQPEADSEPSPETEDSAPPAAKTASSAPVTPRGAPNEPKPCEHLNPDKSSKPAPEGVPAPEKVSH
jgi:hypothetical protein